jgi:hypothetical protein
MSETNDRRETMNEIIDDYDECQPITVCECGEPVVDNDRCAQCNDEYMSEPGYSSRYASEI